MKARTTILCVFFFFFTLFTICTDADAFGPLVLGGAYDELLPTIVRGKPLVFSGKARWEYDDNIYAEEDNEVSSWVFSIEPKLDFHKITDATYFGLFYQLSYRWFENRPEDDEDLSHDIGALLNHMFTDNFELRLRNTYRHREDQVSLEEQVTEAEQGVQPIVERGRRDINESYERNDFEASGIFRLSERFNIIGTYTNMWLDYEDDNLSINNDRTENSPGIRIEYIWKPQTSLSLGYMYLDVDYEQEINKVDSTTDQYYLGINHRFSPSLSSNLNVGWQDRTYDPYTTTDEEGNEVVIEDKNESSPYIDFGISSMISEMLVTSVGYRYSITETDQSMFLSQRMQTFYMSMTNKFSERFSVRFNGIMTFGDFDVDVARVPGAPENMTEDTVQFALVFRYQIREGWFAEAGWRYTDVDSDFPGNTYERNRTFVGLNAVF